MSMLVFVSPQRKKSELMSQLATAIRPALRRWFACPCKAVVAASTADGAVRRLIGLIGIALLAALLAIGGQSSLFAQDRPDTPTEPAANPAQAVIIEFRGVIHPLSGTLLRRQYQAAVERGAKLIVLDIDSPGGYYSTTLELMRMVQETPHVQTVALISHEAISGAALLALATDRIVMLSGSRIGDAGVIVYGEDSAFRYAPEKLVSALTAQLRDLAERHDRPAALLEAMVEKDLVVSQATHRVDGSVTYFSDRDWASREDADDWDRGKVVREASGGMFFTATAARAVELGVADDFLDDRDQLADLLGVSGPIPVIRPALTDLLIDLFHSSFITWLLLVVGMVALVSELTSPGFGVGGVLSAVAFGLFFWSRYLGGTSGWLEVMLFLIGLFLLMLELMVIPGFGVAGLSGGAMVVVSLVMASRRVMMPESSRDLTSLLGDVGVVLAAVVGLVVGVLIMAQYVGQLPILGRLALAPLASEPQTEVAALTATTADPTLGQLQIGEICQTLSPLVPSGRVQCSVGVVNVVSEGDFVPAQAEVQIVAIQGARVVVRQRPV